MSVSQEFEAHFAQVISQAKQSVYEKVCLEIDEKAKTIREMLAWEMARQRETLILEMSAKATPIANPPMANNATNNSSGPDTRVSIKCEMPSDSWPLGDVVPSSATYHQFESLPNNAATSHQVNEPFNSTFVTNSQMRENIQNYNSNNINNHLHPQTEPLPVTIKEESPDSVIFHHQNNSHQLNELQETEEEISYLDSDDDCNCSECQSHANGTAADEDEEASNDGSRKRRKLENNANNNQGPSLHQPGPSNACTKSSTKYVYGIRHFSTISLTCTDPACQMVLPSKAAFDAHMMTAHNTLPCQCLLPLCPQSFGNVDTLLEHRQSSHGPEEQWNCGYCPFQAPNRTSFKTHLYAIHYIGVFQCFQCSFTGPSRAHVDIHFRQVHKDLVCTHPGCGRKFEMVCMLRRHRRIHNAEKPFRCRWGDCTFASVRLDPVKKHIRSQHFGVPETIKEIRAMGIENVPDPSTWIEVIKELL